MSLANVSLEKVYIYFDTATYDEIARDEKVSFFNIYKLANGHAELVDNW